MKPITRKEKFLNAIAEHTVPAMKPITREEHSLKKIAESSAEGGGGGGAIIDFGTIPAESMEEAFELPVSRAEIRTMISNGQDVTIKAVVPNSEGNAPSTLFFRPCYDYDDQLTFFSYYVKFTLSGTSAEMCLLSLYNWGDFGGVKYVSK